MEVKGKMSVAMTTAIVATDRYFPGRLLKKGLRLRITSTMIAAEMTDSMNHPVLNRSGVAYLGKRTCADRSEVSNAKRRVIE